MPWDIQVHNFLKLPDELYHQRGASTGVILPRAYHIGCNLVVGYKWMPAYLMRID